MDGDDQINLTRVKGVCGGWMEMIRLTLQGLRVYLWGLDGDNQINLTRVKDGGWMEMIRLTLQGLRMFVGVGWR